MSITEEEVADAVRHWCTAWHTRDIPTILAMEAQAGGYGFRPLARRDHAARGEADARQTLERFFGRMIAYRLEPEELQTSVIGEVGLAWGVYIETFQEQGHPPNGPGSASPRCSPRGKGAGRCGSITATSNPLPTTGATRRR
jgi:hypothetical protein